jgi:hypothetical protein
MSKINTIQFTVPEADFHNLVACTRNYTVEENAIMLLMGTQCMELLRSSKLKVGNEQLHVTISNLEHKLSFIKEHYKECLVELEERVDEKAEKLAEEKIRAKDQYINDLKETIDNQLLEIVDYKTNLQLAEKNCMLSFMDTETQKRLELFDKHLDTLHSTTKHLSSAHTGDSVDYYKTQHAHIMDSFQEIANKAFASNMGFNFKRIYHSEVNKSILTFKEFSIFCQVVGSEQPIVRDVQDQFIHDFKASDQQFGWFVSMKSNIRSHDEFPITIEWHSCTDDDDHQIMKCVLYVNKLDFFVPPEQLLRMSWNYTHTLQHLMNTSASSAIDDLAHKVFEKKVIDLLQQLSTLENEEGNSLIEINKQITTLKTNNNKAKELINTMLNEKTQDLLIQTLFVEDKKIARIRSWLNSIITQQHDASHYITANEIWEKFKLYNKLDFKLVKKKELVSILTHILHDFIVPGTETNPSFTRHVWAPLKPHADLPQTWAAEASEKQEQTLHCIPVVHNTALSRMTAKPIRRLNGSK